jgi:glycosyltransferase involved in cell wall biosynthesis
MAGRTSPVRVLVVSQLPPPPLGQAIAAQSFITGRYQHIELFPVRMSFSREMAEVGKPRLGKVGHLIALIARILWARVRTGAAVLYYPPAGPDLVPVLRDIAVLLCTRWAFRATVFHFHASGVSEIEPRLPRPLRAMFHRAYGRPDLAIQTSELNPPDGTRLRARRIAVVPNGLPDHPLALRPREQRSVGPPVVLYVGVLRESKGLLVLVEACRRLLSRNLDFELHLMGGFESAHFEARLRAAVDQAGLGGRTVFLGVRSGDAKAACFRAGDLFCYPTHFEAESFGIAAVEAMQFSLPVVATSWRGVPSVVADVESGILVPVRDPERLERALWELVEDPERRSEMGRRGRELYLERFTEERFRREMESVLHDL